MAGRTIEFRRMTEEEFHLFLERTSEGYARLMARTFKRQLGEERMAAKRQVKDQLRHGVKTRGHLLFDVVDSKAEMGVGYVWVYADTRRKRAFIYDIIVFKRYRGSGYGRAIMKLLEETLAEMRIKTIGLHVFAENSTALYLYKTQGFEIGSYSMIKELDRKPGRHTR